MNYLRTILFLFVATTLSSTADTNMVPAVAATNVPSVKMPPAEKCETTEIIVPVSKTPSAFDQAHMDWLGRRVDAIEKNLFDCYGGLKERVDEKVSSEVQTATNKAEEEYAQRYAELKTRESWFISAIGSGLTLVAIIVAVFGIWIPHAVRKREMRVFKDILNEFKKESAAKRKELDDAIESGQSQIATMLKNARTGASEMSKTVHEILDERISEIEKNANAQLLFVSARNSFDFYKTSPTVDILNHVTTDLSQCIKFNILSKNAKKLQSSIAFMRTVMIEDPAEINRKSDRIPVPEQIKEDRNAVFLSLYRRHWSWGFTSEDIKEVLTDAKTSEYFIEQSLDTIVSLFEHYNDEANFDGSNN